MLYPLLPHSILNKEVLGNLKAWAQIPLNQKESDSSTVDHLSSLFLSFISFR